MATVHSRAARSDGARLAAVVSSGGAGSARAAEALGFERSYDSAEQLLADDDIQVVHIVTPNVTHFEFALAALDAGKHVVCEKPLTTNTEDARTLVAAAAAAGVSATVPFVYRFHPMVREARARVRSGETGALLSIQASYLQDWLLERSDDNWRVDRNVGGPSRAFADIGSHLCDLLEFVTGDHIARVQAVTKTVFADRAMNRTVTTEDLAAVLLETRGGVVGTLLVSQVAPGRKNRLQFEISGAEQTVEFNQEDPESLWLGRRQGSQLLRRDLELSADAMRLSVLPPGHPLGYQDAFNAFVADSYANVRGEPRDGLPTFEDGLRAVTITDAVLESAATDSWVVIEGESA
ncbi:MAG: oxidoreductase family, NAD-binding Rossmann fold domain protein [Microbacteriaceae bacterium]|nr:oxidoreductase family, NAD-binding Rossmann fold domain protein [Microbacteriaceae bacterium]